MYNELAYSRGDQMAISAFLEYCVTKGLSQKTLRDYRHRLQYLRQYAGTVNKDITELDKFDIRNYINILASFPSHAIGRKVSPVTINGRIRVFNIFYNFLVSEGILENNPVKAVRLLREPKKVKAIVEPGELTLALRGFDRASFTGFRDFCMMLLNYDSMLRLNELLSIKIEDVNFHKRLIRIWGKGSKERFVPFSAKTGIKLRLYLSLKRDGIPGDLLFPTATGEKICPSNVRRSYRKAGKKAEIKISPHLLRHSAATAYWRKTQDIYRLMLILGHSKIETTRLYIQVTLEDIEKAYDRFSPANQISI